MHVLLQTDASLAAVSLLPPGAESEALRATDRALQGESLEALMAAGHAAIHRFHHSVCDNALHRICNECAYYVGGVLKTTVHRYSGCVVVGSKSK